MEQVIVRHLEPEVRAELLHRAALHGWSMEEEVHQILRNAVSHPAPLRLGSRIAQRFAGVGLVEPLPELHQPVSAPPGFDK
jgi:plasmid stability protein